MGDGRGPTCNTQQRTGKTASCLLGSRTAVERISFRLPIASSGQCSAVHPNMPVDTARALGANGRPLGCRPCVLGFARSKSCIMAPPALLWLASAPLSLSLPRPRVRFSSARLAGNAAACPAAQQPDSVTGQLRWLRLKPASRRRRHPVATAAAAAAPAVPLLQDGWPLWTAFAVCGALGQLIERRTPLGGVLSAPLASMTLALVGAALGLLPTASMAADVVWQYLMPLAAACYLLESDLSTLISSAGTTLAAFAVGAVGTLAGTLVAYRLVGPYLGPEGWKVACALCASYIGGSLNFAAVSQALALAQGPLLAGAMTADSVLMAVYIATIMSIPAPDPPSSSSGSSGGKPAPAAPAGGQGIVPTVVLSAAMTTVAGAGAEEPWSQLQEASGDGTAVDGSSSEASSSSSSEAAAPVTAESLALSLAAAALACSLGNALAVAAGIGSSGLAVMAILASGLAMLGSKLTAWLASRSGGSTSSGPLASPFGGSQSLGSALMMLFFATIGTSAGSLQALWGCGWLVLFILLQLSIHLAVCLLGGRLLRLPMQAVLIASNANVGGPATAAAMASAKGWRHMVQPAMLTGSLGYAIATAIGIALSGWLRTWF